MGGASTKKKDPGWFPDLMRRSVPGGSRRQLMWGVLTTAVLFGLLMAPAMAAPILGLSPSSGRDGTRVTATGSMFPEGGDPEFPPPVAIRFNGVEVAHGYAWGSFSIPFRVPVGTPPGTYTVQAIHGYDIYKPIGTATATFTVVNPPIADFTMDPLWWGVAPVTVHFTDTSKGNPSSWSWDFGDGQTSSTKNPSHIYTSSGQLPITLTVSNAGGSDSYTRYIVVSDPVLTLSPPSGRAEIQVTATGSFFNLFGEESPSADIYFNGVEIAGNIPMTRSGQLLGSFTTSFTVPAGSPPGTYTVRAVGPLDSAEAIFTVTNTPPRALIDASPLSGMTPLPVHFSGTRSYDEEGSIASHQWDFGDGASATGGEVDHTYTRSGDYRARLTVTDEQGASATSSVTISLENIPPVAVARANPTSGSDPLFVNFDGSESYDPDGTIVLYNWDFGDGYWERTTRVSHQYRSPQSYTAVLTVTDDKGMTGQDEVIITVGNERPAADISVSPPQGTAPLTVTLDGSYSYDPDDTDLLFLWDFGDGDGESGRVVTHTYQEEGTYQVSLEVKDPHGATGRASDSVKVVPPFPWWAPVIGVLGAFAGAKIYIDRPRVIGPGQSLPRDCKYPKPQPDYDVHCSVECESGKDRGLPDVSVEVRSGILQTGEKK